MANNNECALSQTSGYTSNSNSTNNFDLKEINGIELNRVTYGADLSERLEDINENFNKIIESDFLRGAPGRSVGISTWVFNDETKDTPMGQSLIAAIMSNNLSTTSDIDFLIPVIARALMNKEIKVIYDDNGNIVSSLPFTFIDPRFAIVNGGNDDGSLADETDLSCVLVYETTNGSNGFVAAQTFPTLYWDSDLEGGNFCWKINGQKTGLPCKGPQGKDGGGGTLYTVLYNPVPIKASNESTACEIIGAMWLNGSDVSDIKNEFIPKSEFIKKQISIKTGDTVIALPGSIENGVISFAAPSSIGTTITSDESTYGYSITTAFVTNGDNYYIVINGDTIHIPYVLESGALSNLMNEIWGPYKLGLYIPSEKSDGTVTKAHTLWTDREDSSNLCIGEVANPAEINKWEENPEPVDRPSTVSLLYDKMSVGKDTDSTKAVTKITKGLVTDIVEMYPESSNYQTVEVSKFENSYWIENIFKTAYGVVGNEYDFSSVYNSGEESYFGIYQPVKINDIWKHAARIISGTNEVCYILWKSLDEFIRLLDAWYECVNQENDDSFPTFNHVQIVKLNDLHIENNDWVCNSVTYVNSVDIRWDIVYRYKYALSIKRVDCTDIRIQEHNALGFIYTVKDDNDGTIYEFVSRTLTVGKNVDDKCILPIRPSNDTDDYCIPFVITGFDGSHIKVENISTWDAGENSFDIHATQSINHQYYRPYYHAAQLLEKYHQYDGKFDQSYSVDTKRYNIKATDINMESTDINVESTNINIEATESHIRSAQHRVGHTPYVNSPDKNLVSFRGIRIHPQITRLQMRDDLGEPVVYDLYIPLCRLIVAQEPGYACVYKIQATNGTKLPTHLILWSEKEENIINFYKTYYDIQRSAGPFADPIINPAGLKLRDIFMYEGYIEEPYVEPSDPHSVASSEQFVLNNAYPEVANGKMFARDDVSIYTDRIEWIERDPHSYPPKRYTINLSPTEIDTEISSTGGAFIIAKDVSETRSQDPSKYVIIMCDHGRHLSYENLGEEYLSNESLIINFKNIYKYDESGQDTFNKVLIINRPDTVFPATDSSCETWQEKVCTRGSEIKNDCSEYSVYCHQFFVNGIDIVPLLPKLQELVSSSNS